MYVVKGARQGEKLLCDKIYNILGKWGCKEYKKRKFGKQLGKRRKKFTKYKRMEKTIEKILQEKI